MHASTDQLLSIRDAQPVAAEVAQHVRHCPICSEQLSRLARIREQLCSLPQHDAPAAAWEQIQMQLSHPAKTARLRRFGIAAAVAAVAMLAVVITAAVREPHVAPTADARAPHDPAPPSSQVDPSAHVAELVAQSQQLEGLLQSLPQRPRIERASTAATVDTIEQRIQWLDFQLSYASEGGLDEVQARRLWRERVELMDSLVKVRYAETGRLSF
jgi:hypothetical protein